MKVVVNISRLVIYIVFLSIFLLSFAEGNSIASNLYIKGIASWYSEFSPGIRETTANMEIFNHDRMTCAIWDIPFNTLLEVTNLSNGKKTVVRVNDRGPNKRLCRKGRVIDLTMAAFEQIEDLDKGLTKVKIRILN